MLKASAEAEFVVTLREALPQNFTIEFDLIPKACCNPADLSFEGPPTRGQSSAPVSVD